MSEEPKLEVIVDNLGHEIYRISHNGFLLDKEQAEYVAERIKRLEQENAKLREFAADACTVLRNHYDKDWFDGTIFAERMHELGIEVDG